MKIRQGSLLAMLLGAVLLTATALIPATANAAAWVPIFAARSGKCLDERLEDPFRHARIQIWGCQYRNKTLVSQQGWRAYFVKPYQHGGETWQVYQILNQRTQLCLEIPDSVPSTAPDGTQADLFTCDPTRDSQLWGIRKAGQAIELVNINSVKCLDVRGNSTANGAVVQQYKCNGTRAQQFYMPGFTS